MLAARSIRLVDPGISSCAAPPRSSQAHAGDGTLRGERPAFCMGPAGAIMALVVLLGDPGDVAGGGHLGGARMGLAMSRDRVMPAFLRASARKETRHPMGGDFDHERRESGAARARARYRRRSSTALTNAASSLGLISIVFYGITAAAALRQQRDVGGRKPRRSDPSALFSA